MRVKNEGEGEGYDPVSDVLRRVYKVISVHEKVGLRRSCGNA
jgi:hypothetical protein